MELLGIGAILLGLMLGASKSGGKPSTPVITKPTIETIKTQDKALEVIKITKPIAAVMNHIHIIQELKKKFEDQMSLSIEKPKPSGKSRTQTEAFLSVYRKDINRMWSSELKKYDALINRAMEREREFVDTHYVFYHAHILELIILQDFIKQIYAFMQLTYKPTHFNFIRFKNLQTVDYDSVDSYLDDGGGIIHDSTPAVAAKLLSVNLSLFGNFNHSGYCSFYYFYNNQSAFSPNLKNFLQSIFDYYDFDKTFIDELVALQKLLNSKEGNMMQIFIPKDSVDSLVYSSVGGGRINTTPILKKYFDFFKNRHIGIAPILEYYRKHPEKIQNLENLQARVLFREPMLNPESGVKIFRYNMVSQENMIAYEQKMQDIVARMMSDYIKKLPVMRNEPFFRLNKYMHMQDVLSESFASLN